MQYIILARVSQMYVHGLLFWNVNLLKFLSERH